MEVTLWNKEALPVKALPARLKVSAGDGFGHGLTQADTV
jgi:hypothetical protein